MNSGWSSTTATRMSLRMGRVCPAEVQSCV
jgi:hypothetical protein